MSQFDQYAKNYSQVVDSALAVTGEGKDYFAQSRVQWIAKYLQKSAVRPRVMLDYGCGNGSNAALLLEGLHLDSLVGVDVSEKSIGEARRTAPPGASFSAVPDFEPQEQADLAYCCGVFHHIVPAERQSALDYVVRALRPGGLFTFFEHNPWNPGTRHIMADCEFDQDAITLPPTEAVSRLREAGFEVIDKEFLFFFPRQLAILRPLEPALKRIPLGGQYVVVGRKPGK